MRTIMTPVPILDIHSGRTKIADNTVTSVVSIVTKKLPLFLSIVKHIKGLKIPRRYFYCGSFVLCMSCVYHAFASVHCCLVVTRWEKAASWFSFAMFYCGFVTFQCGILDKV